MATKQLRAVGIVRVSQIDDGAQSPETQALRIIDRCQREGWLLDADDIRDENVLGNGNVSGGADLDHRPGLGPAVAMIERGTHQVLVAAHLDRLFRDLDLQREVIRRVEAAGGRIEAVDMGRVSHDTAAGELNANLNGSIAQYIRRTTKERSMDAVTQAIQQGKAPWPQTPPGYLRTPESTLVPDQTKVPIVRKAFALRARGKTIADVRTHLAEHGIDRSYHGAQHLLRDRIYLGEIHFKDRVNLAAHSAIIDRDLFEQVQRIAIPRGRRAQSDRLLARLGVLRCATCGGRMTVGTHAENGRRWSFYRCPAVRQDCHQRASIGAEIVEGLVVEAVKEALADVEGRASAEAGVRDAARDAERARTNYEAALELLQDFTDAAAVKRLRDLRSAWEEARARVDQLGGQQAAAAVTISAAEDWDKLTHVERRALIKATVESVTVGPGRGTDRVMTELVGD